MSSRRHRGPLALFIWICAKAGRAAIFGLMAQFRLALSTGCILGQNLLMMAQDFWTIKAGSRQIGTVKTFENFALDLPPAIDLGEYDAVVIWCEAFK
jgi:hypothetical protein